MFEKNNVTTHETVDQGLTSVIVWQTCDLAVNAVPRLNLLNQIMLKADSLSVIVCSRCRIHSLSQ